MKLTFAGNEIHLQGTTIQVGDQAPDFLVLDKDLNEVHLSDYRGKVVVLTSFPSIDTGICSMQAIRFNQAMKTFNDVQVITISVDLPFALSRFCADNGIDNAITTSDYRQHDFGQKYGLLIQELKLLARAVVIVDANGIVQYVDIVDEIKTHVDYDKALASVQTLLA